MIYVDQGLTARPQEAPRRQPVYMLAISFRSVGGVRLPLQLVWAFRFCLYLVLHLADILAGRKARVCQKGKHFNVEKGTIIVSVTVDPYELLVPAAVILDSGDMLIDLTVISLNVRKFIDFTLVALVELWRIFNKGFARTNAVGRVSWLKKECEAFNFTEAFKLFLSALLYKVYALKQDVFFQSRVGLQQLKMLRKILVLVQKQQELETLPPLEKW
ncbi:hypothetical protein K435DRAFT_803780 [Dendrothele bispora CBS 962.96]|uniref:Uncharacterized protein n=1 Tax=Dendrothele bispora (strain CBS 962.96) TaxID=1314807 RepID=A0A4S8LHP9_DENBC|nr:hypothetical protein K435DRAFT_803780 [Dendrothele bispora CBS 962.96]